MSVMRALVLHGAGRPGAGGPGAGLGPQDDVALALLSAGIRVVVAPAEALSRLDGESFDAVFLDADVLRAALPTRIAFRALVLLGRDSPWLETPALTDLLEATANRDAVAALYAVACPDAFAALPATERLTVIFQRCPAVPGHRFRPPVLREIAPAERTAFLAPVAPAADATAGAGRILYRGAFVRPAGPLAEQPSAGRIGVADLRSIAEALFERDRCFLPKARCMARLLADRNLRWPEDHASWRGLAELFQRIDMMNVRLPLVTALRRAFGDRFVLEGPGWGAAGLAARESGGAASVRVDLGSRRLDTGWHPGAREILEEGGTLLRPDRPDGDAVFGPAAPVFRDQADLLAQADALLSGRAAADMAAVRDHVARVVDPAAAGAALRDALERAVAGRRPTRLRLDLTHGPGWAGDLVRRLRDSGRPRDCLVAGIELMAAGASDPALLAIAATGIEAVADAATPPLAAVDALPETAACDPATRLKLAAAVAVVRGDDVAMEAHARDSLTLRSDDTLIATVAQRRLPGPDYVAWLGHLHRRLRPAVYLEIGIMHGTTLALAAAGTLAVGVDPCPLLAAGRPGNWRIFPVTSDAFFAGRPFDGDLARPDFVFLDGLHLFEQTLRDVVNTERAAHRGTVMCIHDCLAFDARTARRRRATDFWTGDVWKIVPILLEHRPDLTVTVIPAHPTGLVMVTGLDPESRVLDARFDALVETWRRRRFGAAVTRDWPLVANRWDAVEPALAACGAPR